MAKSIRKCSIDGCENKHNALGFCVKHYTRLRTHGDPSALRPNAKKFPDDARKQGSCLLWEFRVDTSGYGRVNVDGNTVLAHRHAWERVNGRVPDGSMIDHICHNRTCVNVLHLRIATRAQNNSNRSGATVESSTGVRNIYPRGRKFYVMIRKNGIAKNYGTYDTIEDAARVAEKTRAELFGSFAGRG